MEDNIHMLQTSPVLGAVKVPDIPSLYGTLNSLIERRLIGVSVRYGTSDLSVLRFEPGQRSWVELIIENPMKDQYGELRIRVKGLPPILIYKL